MKKELIPFIVGFSIFVSLLAYYTLSPNILIAQYTYPDVLINTIDNEELLETESFELNSSNSIGQTILSTQNNLNRVDITLSLPNQVNNSNIIFKLIELGSSLNFGRSTDLPIAGDWNGDGKDTIGVFRPSSHTFYLDFNDDGINDENVTFGESSDLPIAGDWNGDGKDTIGVFRPSSHTFYLDFNNDGIDDDNVTFGESSDLPIAGDWNGDGKDTIGTYRQWESKFYLLDNISMNTNSVIAYGIVGYDRPVIGDWEGEEKDSLGIFRRCGARFYFRSNDGSQQEQEIRGIKNPTSSGYIKFEFQPIEDSQGKYYYFYLKSADQSMGRNPMIAYYSNNVYSEGNAFKNNETLAGDQKFKAYCSLGGLSFLSSGFIMMLESDKTFAVTYICFIFVLIFIVLKY